jgi:hypothetical protein
MFCKGEAFGRSLKELEQKAIDQMLHPYGKLKPQNS